LGNGSAKGFTAALRRLRTMIVEKAADIRQSVELMHAGSILRRYFVMNAFDGALTALGVVFGGYITSLSDPVGTALVIVSTGVAMCVSGFSGAYMTEGAERQRELDELEQAMLTDLGDSVYRRASTRIALLAAIVDGLAPLGPVVAAASPFVLSVAGFMNIRQSYILSVCILLSTLFFLGLYLGRISRKRLLPMGVKMVASGIVVSAISLLLDTFHN